MSNTLDDYREAKNNYLKLRNLAKKDLVNRFNELANELLQIQRELLEDFGEKVTIPSKSKKPRPTKPASKPGSDAPKPSTPTEPAAAAPFASPKLLTVQRQLEQQRKKLAHVQAAGKPTKSIEDRIYELEDELRFAVHAN
jgi:hypothetical protein